MWMCIHSIVPLIQCQCPVLCELCFACVGYRSSEGAICVLQYPAMQPITWSYPSFLITILHHHQLLSCFTTPFPIQKWQSLFHSNLALASIHPSTACVAHNTTCSNVGLVCAVRNTAVLFHHSSKVTNTQGHGHGHGHYGFSYIRWLLKVITTGGVRHWNAPID